MSENIDVVVERIDNFIINNTKEHKHLSSFMKELKAQVNTLERWKWAIAGGIGAIGIAKFSDLILNLFK